MKVKEIMTRDAKVCDLNASVAEAAKMMWDNDCGVLPVLKDGKEIVGLITDRDICMGVAIRDRNPSGISVEEVMTGAIYSVTPDDDVHQALETMEQYKVRRLPVVDAEGLLKGVLSMNDLTLYAEEQAGRKAPELTFTDVMKTYKAVCAHPSATQQSDESMSATV
jgi:CBS domain-containing protein